MEKLELTKEMKVLLINILKQGYITAEQSEKLIPLVVSDPFRMIRKNSGIE